MFFIFQGSAFALNEEGSSVSPVFSDEMKAQIEQNKILFEKSLQPKTTTKGELVITTDGNETISGTTEQENQVQKATEPVKGDTNNKTDGKNNTIGLWLISIFNSVCLLLLLITRKTPKK
ncbi:hypothetical protein AUJ87_04325 [Candidatus Gracilibacteria bacterium CG1_02_38_174]|nr:MAG: hypothetical protein AUJ87_04325 [Candidatus Gracilibacteria bacterium CG1_02_38_174]PIQ10763.1 MAG: hypothetical protein COW68_03750 [Candidatus Gracilibacteria bacterium CG18_big_fil_WC_8_21_14_2_50_38_16]PIQ42035.1 MAG: hypothetical protein COW06_00825 [Candidatus Gracilibacteria bacterium CG12_big_fil_rev_8_21_14_0_65_38_15]